MTTNVLHCSSTPQQIPDCSKGSALSLGNMWPGFAVERGFLPSSKRSTARYCLLFLPPVVWSWEGPVFGVGVGPLCLIQSKSSLVACSHLQKSTSNVQDILQAVGAAVYGSERKQSFHNEVWNPLSVLTMPF